MKLLVVFFSVTFLLVSTSLSQIFTPRTEFNLIVVDKDEDLIPRPILDPDFEADLRDYCEYEGMDTSHLDEKEEKKD